MVEALVSVAVCCTVKLVEMFASPTTSSFASVEVADAPIKTWLVVVETRIPELLKNVQLISLEPPAPASDPHENFPVVALYKTLSPVLAHAVNPSCANEPETRRLEVVAKPLICKPVA